MATAPLILTIDDLQIVSIYKYLGIWLDEKLAFDVHINYLVKRLKPRLGFLFWQKKMFPFMGTRTASPRGRYGERPQRDSCLKIHM